MSRLLFLFTLILTFVSHATSTTIHVPGDQPTIQAGLNTAAEGDTVLVAAGTYFENIIWPAVNGVKLIGSGEDECIIDGDSLASVIRFEENLAGIIDNSTLISGFTIQNGHATGNPPQNMGGGIYCYESSPGLIDMILTGNIATDGGGIYCESSSPLMEDVTITGNSSTTRGGGIGCYYSDPGLSDVILSNNDADEGAGIYFHASSPTVTGAFIYNNSAVSGGGGIFCSGSNPQLNNVLLYRNTSLADGGGICCSGASPTLLQVTLSENSAASGGGIHCKYGSHPVLENCIMWNDSPQEGSFLQNSAANSLSISCSDIQGGETGIETNGNGIVYWLENNISADPWFCNPENDYRLQLNSPCRTDVCGFMGYTGETCDGEGVEGLVTEPSTFHLVQNYPNPFNPSTTIDYSVAAPSEVTLSVYNINGQLVDVIHDGFMQAGYHTAPWTPSDLSSGIYFVELRAGVDRDVMKVSYVK